MQWVEMENWAKRSAYGVGWRQLEDVHEQLAKEEETLAKEMNDYVKDFIIENYENVLGPGVFMMMRTLPYPIMTPRRLKI